MELTNDKPEPELPMNTSEELPPMQPANSLDHGHRQYSYQPQTSPAATQYPNYHSPYSAYPYNHSQQ